MENQPTQNSTSTITLTTDTFRRKQLFLVVHRLVNTPKLDLNFNKEVEHIKTLPYSTDTIKSTSQRD